MDPTEPLIYLDHAATTAVHPQVLEAMLPYLGAAYGNPSSIHSLGRQAHRAIEKARASVAQCLGAQPDEIVFTSCGTESDNLALRGTLYAAPAGRDQIITSQIEHHAVSRTCEQLETLGYHVTYLPVDRHGLVDPDDVGRAIDEHTALISIMYANNEVGTIEPIAEIARIARQHGVPMHSDAVQAPGSLDLNVERLNVDMLSLSGHKFYAPKGIGVLYVRRGSALAPAQTGGAQERYQRAGTENVAGIVGLARALELVTADRESESARQRALCERLIDGLGEAIPYCRLMGHPTQRLPNNVHLVFEGIVGEALIARLDLVGLAVSSGSACAAGEEGESPVLRALGLDPQLAQGGLRMTLGRENTPADIDRVIAVLPGVVQSLRELSPVSLGQARL